MKNILKGAVRCILALAVTIAAGTLQAAPPSDLVVGLERATVAQQRHEAKLLARAGVVGVGLALNANGVPIIRILAADAGVREMPQLLDGVTVETIVTGRLQAQQVPGPLVPTDRWPRPVPIGVSIAHPDVTAGTLGVRVYRGTSARQTHYILSNNHVIANLNLALLGDVVLQPGPYDGGTAPADVIALLSDSQNIVFSPSAANKMDAAIAAVVSGAVGMATPPDGYGLPSRSTLNPALGMAVMKYGRTTRLSSGTITGINYSVIVDYSGGLSAGFTGQTIITGAAGSAFSAGGDSGSLVVASSGIHARRPVALLFGGNGNISVASPIKPILSRFNVKISGQ